MTRGAMSTVVGTPVVSVIIPTRDRLAFLKEAVGSVLGQTLSACEAIVVNDASSDGTTEWLAEQETERLTTLTFEQHRERAVARNSGLEKARGEFVLFLDDDDRLRHSALEKLHSALERDLQANGAVGALVLFDASANRRRLPHPRRLIERGVWTDLLAFWMPPLGTTLFRTNVLKAVGGWNPAITVSGDRELFIRVSRQGPVLLVPEVVLDKRTHGGQWRAVEIREIQGRWVREHIDGLPSGDRELAEQLTRAYRLLNDARIAYGNLESRKAISLYGQALRVAPSLLRSPLVRPEIVRGVTKSSVGLVLGRRGILAARQSKRTIRRLGKWDVEEVKGRKSVKNEGVS